MTMEEFQTMTTEILANMSDTGAVSERLDKLRTAFNEEVTAKETANNQVTELTAKNESLQQANMALYLKTGVQTENTEDDETDEPEITFDDLFDDKGELK